MKTDDAQRKGPKRPPKPKQKCLALNRHDEPCGSPPWFLGRCKHHVWRKPKRGTYAITVPSVAMLIAHVSKAFELVSGLVTVGVWVKAKFAIVVALVMAAMLALSGANSVAEPSASPPTPEPPLACSSIGR